ncbi:MAG: EAL domain-containing protein [Sneathiella sp.]|nr:EAL domain-containing protein [Sneathiella sp.]
MYEVVSCLTNEHDHYHVLIAVILCVFGCLVTGRLFIRTKRNSSFIHSLHWVFLSAVVGGCTIWATHFVAMIGYQPLVDHAYDPLLTLSSLFLAIVMSFIGFALAASTQRSFLIEIGGAILGAGIASMHFLGMKAFIVAGDKAWDPALVNASIFFSLFFGALAFNRMARPVTRFCRYGGIIALIIGIALTHFTAMGALTIYPNPTLFVPPSMLPDTMLIIGVVSLIALVIGSGLSVHLLDNRQQTETQQFFRHLSQHDALTGLPHYHYLLSKHEDRLQDMPEDSNQIAVIKVELSGLEQVRTVHGPAVSDAIVKVIAERLNNITGPNEIIARGRQDRLVAVKAEIINEQQLDNFITRLQGEFTDPVSVMGHVVTVDFKAGATLFPQDTSAPEQILGHAEMALNRALQSHTKAIEFYDPKIDESHRSRNALSMELRHAIERDELELYYQPQIDVMSGNLIGFEVLIRWIHPERGMVSPVDFIPIAEETGLITPIGEWVLHTACREAASWKNPYKIVVNVAPAQLARGDLPHIILDILGETGLDAKRLELEITETSIIEDHNHTLSIVRQLKQLGISIAMDDFGTGYSSLSMLQSFPFDKIKIDRSFISGVRDNPQSAAISRATIVLADGLQIKTLAEGVEDENDLSFLQEHGCQEAQGYFFGKPVPVQEIRDIVNADLEDQNDEDGGKVFQLSNLRR